MNTHTIYRDSITGQIVTAEYAQANPDTTQSETVEDHSGRSPFVDGNPEPAVTSNGHDAASEG